MVSDGAQGMRLLVGAEGSLLAPKFATNQCKQYGRPSVKHQDDPTQASAQFYTPIHPPRAQVPCRSWRRRKTFSTLRSTHSWQRVPLPATEAAQTVSATRMPKPLRSCACEPWRLCTVSTLVRNIRVLRGLHAWPAGGQQRTGGVRHDQGLLHRECVDVPLVLGLGLGMAGHCCQSPCGPGRSQGCETEMKGGGSCCVPLFMERFMRACGQS